MRRGSLFFNNENDAEMKQRYLAAVKKEVKQLMEEAVTRKFVHEESGSVTALCAAVEACLGHGLRRRALGLFKTSSTTALLHKVAKHCEEAAVISQKVLEAETGDSTKRSSSSGDSTNKGPPPPPTLSKKNSATSILAAMQNGSGQVKYLWIRLALYEKKLARIIDHLARHAARYYERDALVADPDYGSILSSLLVGPCALDYSRSKTPDHFWTDPPADELVQRHRISSGHPTPAPCRRPMLNFKRSLHTSSEEGRTKRAGPQIQCAKDYVESLHQNARATLLYGKNNVKVLPKDATQPMAGYLSLHQSAQSLTIKWTPNQLMNGYSESEVRDKGSYWDYALNILVDEIVYVHCHQSAGESDGASLILVGQDGVQRPPIMFPGGGHLGSFLSCLETGLLPHGQLDPPLWSARSAGKIFPRPPKLRRRPLPSVHESQEEPSDYVFRIFSKTNHEDIVSRHELLDRSSAGRPPSRTERGPLSSCSTASSESSSKSLSLDTNAPESPLVIAHQTDSLALVCSTMKRQIISRAFYGWLAYCRHLSTVRTHLSGLVQPNITCFDGAEEGLTADKWASLSVDGVITDYEEVYRLAYWGGVEHELRKEVWPYLLGHYTFGTTESDRAALDAQTRQSYETAMSEWLAVEAIVRQRDKEATAASIAKLSSESASHSDNIPAADALLRDGSNDVFEDCCSLSDEEATCLDANHQGHFANGTISIPDTPAHQSLQNSVDMHQSEEEAAHVNQDGEQGLMAGALLEAGQVADAVETGSGGSRADQFMTPEEEALFERFEDFDCLQSERKDEGDEGAIGRRGSDKTHSVIVTNPSVDVATLPGLTNADPAANDLDLDVLAEEQGNLEPHDPARSNCASPVSSNGGVYSMELLETFGLNLHRIDKDVQRCDRNYWYFSESNLDKLRNVMCTYVWAHLDTGYMQGMCDLAAPLLVILDDESQTHACFKLLMERMIDNFPNGGAMDAHFANMRSLIQILDAEMFELMHAHGDYTHFYFCYRWFLLDFKRELLYKDVFLTWEVIWAARHVASSHLVLFLALAFLETYRDIILSNSMDFTDIIKFFNEMAERHNAKAVLSLARDLVLQLQTLMENK